MKTQPVTGTLTGITPDTESATNLAFSNVDMDTGASTVYGSLIGFALPASGGPVAGGTTTNPIAVQGIVARGASVSSDLAVLICGEAYQTDWPGTIGGSTAGTFACDDIGRLIAGPPAPRALREHDYVELTDNSSTEVFASNTYRHEITSFHAALLSGTGVTVKLLDVSTEVAAIQLDADSTVSDGHDYGNNSLSLSTSTAVNVQLSATGHKVAVTTLGWKNR